MPKITAPSTFKTRNQYSKRVCHVGWTLAFLLLSPYAGLTTVFADDSEQTPHSNSTESADPTTATSADPEESQVVTFESDFFHRYDPVTALDMVRQVPGFKLESSGGGFGGGPSVRGFGAAAGNILINGKRPSTKSDSMDDVLSRIAAGDVLRLELIRGATGATDRDITQGSVVVNVVLADRTSGRDPAPWEVALQWEDGALSPFAEFAVSTRVNNTKYLVGLKRTAFDWDVRGPEAFTSPTRPSERRDEIQFRDGDDLSLDLKSETQFITGSTLRLNAKAALKTNNGLEVSNRLISSERTDLFLRSNNSETDEVEFGGDYERKVSSNLALKLIGLLSRTHVDGNSALNIARSDDSAEVSLSSTASDDGETIGRLEFDWSKWSHHAIKFGSEIANNFVESDFELFFDDGSGQVAIEVPGSNTRVSERRAEAFASDTWPLSETTTVDFGFAVELSKIEQSGDIGNSRSFTYPKPTVGVTLSPSAVSQWRFRAERQVSQLNFFDFVSSSNFEDADLDFGNPDLRPERTWHVTSTHERRFGDLSVIEIGAFYDKIDDVEDLLPVGENAEIVGNIGDGTRWGGSIRLTVPLTFLGLKDSRLDLTFEAQDSSVTDPVTGGSRALSGESDRTLEASFRKEIPKLNAAIGGNFNWGSTPTVYGFDELVAERPRSHMNYHLEARVWKGFKARFEVFNILDRPQTRKRTVYDGSRLSSPVAFEERRSRIDGQWFRLTLSGLF